MSDERRFGRYRVTRSLGAGAMGEVFEAVDDVLGREVAIKSLRTIHGALAHLADERFRQEARAIAQLSHPHVVQVFDLDLAGEPPYLVMERVAGPSLHKRLEAGPLSTHDLVALGIQIARALAAAHAAGVVHRDVKPANILAAGTGAWKLADFGVAHVPDSSLTITGQFVGSPAYAAPEALVRGESSTASDVYALGATLYQAAAGRWPRAEAGGAPLAPVPPLGQLAPTLPAPIAAAIDRAIAQDAAARPTAAEFADLLAGTSTQPSVVVHTPARWKLWVIGGALALVLLVAIGARHGSTGDRPLVPTAPAELDDHARDELDHIADDLKRGHYGPARDKLDRWERRYGQTDDSRELRDALPPDEGPPGPPGHRKHGKHDED